ncbi:hypothetical protein C8Q74DRAFT_1363425 [Fomes fomentarius]|nr:hypothetical protein C8Q74DRAFT_1363425 [Fomes fomentarius]
MNETYSNKYPELPTPEAVQRTCEEYGNYLPPIPWSDFPIDYIKEKQELWRGLNLLTRRMPRFHYGFLLSGEEVHKWGARFRGDWRKENPDYDVLTAFDIEHGETSGKPPPLNGFPYILYYLNEALAKEGYQLKFEVGEALTKDTAGDPASKICSIIHTERPETWKTEEEMAAAEKVCRTMLDLSQDRQPMWYFDITTNSPLDHKWRPFDPERVVGVELLEAFPPYIQDIIYNGSQPKEETDNEKVFDH